MVTIKAFYYQNKREEDKEIKEKLSRQLSENRPPFIQVDGSDESAVLSFDLS